MVDLFSVQRNHDRQNRTVKHFPSAGLLVCQWLCDVRAWNKITFIYWSAKTLPVRNARRVTAGNKLAFVFAAERVMLFVTLYFH